MHQPALQGKQDQRHSWERSPILSSRAQFHSNGHSAHLLSTPALTEVTEPIEPRSCAHCIAQALLLFWVKESHWETQAGPKWNRASPQQEPSTITGEAQLPRQPSSSSSSSSYRLPRPELCNSTFTTLNLNPILCSRKQQRTPPEASATGQNSLASPSSCTPLQLPVSVLSVCKGCHESDQGLFHKLGRRTAAQCHGHRKGCPSAFLSNNSSGVHTAMGNSRGIHLLGWFSYTFPFSLADGFELRLQTYTFKCSEG